MSLGLILHSGAKEIDRSDIPKYGTPEVTMGMRNGKEVVKHKPIPHELLVRATETELKFHGFEIAGEAYGMTEDGNRFFGVMQLKGNNRDGNEGSAGDYQRMLGLRNSHDKSFAGGLAIGSRVMVCDNLAFSGELCCTHKHTAHIVEKLTGMIHKAMGGLGQLFDFQDRRIKEYKQADLAQTEVSDTIIKLLEGRAIAGTQVLKVVEEYRKPSNECGTHGKLWNLFNAVTEQMKTVHPAVMCTRTQRMHKVLDDVSGLVWKPIDLGQQIMQPNERANGNNEPLGFDPNTVLEER